MLKANCGPTMVILEVLPKYKMVLKESNENLIPQVSKASYLLERDRMAQGEPNQLYWAGFFLFGPFPEENMFGFS